MQVNKGSINGSFGFTSQKLAHEIIGRRLADFIASDAHSQYSRTPIMSDIHEYICEKFSPDYANFLLRQNPRRVIRNEKIYGF